MRPYGTARGELVAAGGLRAENGVARLKIHMPPSAFGTGILGMLIRLDDDPLETGDGPAPVSPSVSERIPDALGRCPFGAVVLVINIGLNGRMSEDSGNGEQRCRDAHDDGGTSQAFRERGFLFFRRCSSPDLS